MPQVVSRFPPVSQHILHTKSYSSTCRAIVVYIPKTKRLFYGSEKVNDVELDNKREEQKHLQDGHAFNTPFGLFCPCKPILSLSKPTCPRRSFSLKITISDSPPQISFYLKRTPFSSRSPDLFSKLQQVGNLLRKVACTICYLMRS